MSGKTTSLCLRTLLCVSLAALGLWLAPTSQAQFNITANPGLTRLINKATTTTSNTVVITTLPSNTASLSFVLENTGANSITYTITFSAIGVDTTAASQNVACTQNPTGQLVTQPASTFAAFSLGPNNFASFSCPYPTAQKIQITLSATAANSQWSLSLFCAASQPYAYGQTTSAQSLSNSVNNFAVITEKGPRWSVLSTPAVSTQASASKAAGAAGLRHVTDCVNYTAGAIAAPVATQLTLNLRDGASGAGTIIWSKTLTIPATAAPHYDFSVCGLNLTGTAATAMTLEFSALLTNEFESVTLTGYDVN